MTAYCLWDIREIHDHDAMSDYVARVGETVTAFGGEYVVVGGPWQIVEGDWHPAHPVLITFPSLDQAHAWYRSELYAPLRELRLGAASGDAVFFDGVMPSSVRAADAPLADVGFDLYREVHKGIRRGLFQMVELAGTVDPRDSEALAAAHGRLACLLHLLDVHAAHEDEFLAPVIERHLPVLAARLHREHDALEGLTVELRRLSDEICSPDRGHATVDERRLAQHRAYLTLTEFVAAYLDHQATEEAVVLPALNRAADIEELLQANADLVAAITPEDLDGYMRLIVPAVNPLDLAELYGGMRAGAPADAFAALLDLAREGLAPDDYARLTDDLALV